MFTSKRYGLNPDAIVAEFVSTLTFRVSASLSSF